MTPSEVEAMIKNLNTRTTAIEQILPTLATKEDLTSGLNGVEARLGARIDSLKSQMLSLHEDVKGDLRMLAAHVADIPKLTGQVRQLTENVASLAQKIDGPPRRRR